MNPAVSTWPIANFQVLALPLFVRLGTTGTRRQKNMK
jgi:hypothetical protein